MADIILCCDLDRTLLPNGLQPESRHSRLIFRNVIQQCNITLVYVTGRDVNLLQSAIDEFSIPIPDYAICDVGTSMYKQSHQQWQSLAAWTEHLAQEWPQAVLDKLSRHFGHHPQLKMQEAAKQGRFKLSFYIDPTELNHHFVARLETDLRAAGFSSHVIASVDETSATGLVDILPTRASKYHAIDFLINQLGMTFTNTVFAGDSGNDLQVIGSKIPAIVVNNAQTSVKTQAQQLAAQHGHEDSCYIAHGDWQGLNGNYSAGIIEGLVHYHPALANKITTIIQQINHSET